MSRAADRWADAGLRLRRDAARGAAAVDVEPAGSAGALPPRPRLTALTQLRDGETPLVQTPRDAAADAADRQAADRDIGAADVEDAGCRQGRCAAASGLPRSSQSGVEAVRAGGRVDGRGIVTSVLGAVVIPTCHPQSRTRVRIRIRTASGDKASGRRDPRTVAALTAALKDTDKDVRETAMHALVQMRDPQHLRAARRRR